MIQNPLFKKILGLLAGFVAFFIVVLLCEKATATAYPLPNANATTVDEINAVIKMMPLGAFAMLIAGYAIGAFVGGFIAVFTTKNNLSIAIILGVGLLIATILNFTTYIHPLWVAISSCVAVLLFAWLGGRYALHHYVLPNAYKSNKPIE
jgi:hypothetical protein